MFNQPAGLRDDVLPLYEERPSITKRRLITGRVRVSRVTRVRGKVFNVALVREHVEIERTAIGKAVDVMPSIRQEGDVIVIPIVEEVLVVKRRLVLKEEIRVRRVRTNQNHAERVMLRQQEAVVTRDRVQHPAAAGAAEVTINTNQAG